MKETFGPRLARLIKEAGHTHASLAAVIEKDQDTVTSWCNEESSPRFDDFEGIAKALAVSPPYLMFAIEPQKQADYETWCQRYGYEDNEEAREDYQKYCDNLAALSGEE